ncbi:RidA family protein [Nitratireductor soli]|uniref:RidA family protein n=1 Tax=Nitratireductor soli TaxID=1670619 RepID=UPI00065DF24F|nr:RidA family protein [Nitratireductor soli]
MTSSNVRHNPAELAPPTQNLYSHAVEVPEGCRTLHVAGQIGVRPDGTIADTLEEQVEQLMKNFEAILASAKMNFADVVKINAYCLTAADIITYAGLRNRYFNGKPPATTAVVVAGLALPQWKIEADLVAAKRG